MKLLNTGLLGFAIFFSIILCIKLTVYLFSDTIIFNIETMDVYHSIFGSALFILNSAAKKYIF